MPLKRCRLLCQTLLDSRRPAALGLLIACWSRFRACAISSSNQVLLSSTESVFIPAPHGGVVTRHQTEELVGNGKAGGRLMAIGQLKMEENSQVGDPYGMESSCCTT
jgi:hypothetical protein